MNFKWPNKHFQDFSMNSKVPMHLGNAQRYTRPKIAFFNGKKAADKDKTKIFNKTTEEKIVGTRTAHYL